MEFKLQSKYKPAGDQPQAIENIVNSFNNGKKIISLLGATGTGKTFTMANIIKKLGIPTLVLSHNKTLAAQLATEFKYFFPKNAVHYFVSYFDYYQPESYVPTKDVYIEGESTINKEIEMFRLSSMASLLTRKDVIVISSVSALYGLGNKEVFENSMIHFEVGKKYSFNEIKKKLIYMQYKAVQGKIEPGMFDIKGEIIDIYSSLENILYRLIFDEEILEIIQTKDSITFKDLGNIQKVNIWPSSQFLQDTGDLDKILKRIKNELDERIIQLESMGKMIESNRLNKKINYDLRMIKETGFVKGIENYSFYFDNRLPGYPPQTIFDYFPNEFLLIIDESHMSIPQIRGMPSGDRTRKTNLVEYGFRLPSTLEHRPLGFEEVEKMMGWKKNDSFVTPKLLSKTIFLSATPGEYEIGISDDIFQQIIRPTGLLDPMTYIFPKSNDYKILEDSLDQLIKKNNSITKFLNGFEDNINLNELLNN